MKKLNNDGKIAFASIAVLLLLNISVQAWEFPFAPAWNSKEHRWNNLIADLSTLNSPENIKLLNQYMEANRVYVVGFYVTDLQKPFWVAYNEGITTRQFDAVNFALTEGQVRQLKGMVEDGKISSWEKFRIWLMLR